MDEAARERLRQFIEDAAENPVAITRLEPLAGGAVQENWLLDVTVEAGEWAGDHALVLKRDALATIGASHGRAEEFRLLKAAHKAGVTVPTPCLVCEDASVIGRPFFVMHRVRGEAAGHRLVKRGADEALAARLGRELAAIHSIRPAEGALAFLKVPDQPPALVAVAEYRAFLDAFADPHPALEWVLRRLELEAPEAPKTEDVVLCHRDFRTGNYMVDEAGELTGILDWEFAHWGQPEEDIGWFCAKCWRFGADDREAGGIAGRGPFYRAYEAASGRAIAREGIKYWEAMAHVRWAIIACQQAERHVQGGEESLELALTAHLVPELEREAMAMMGGGTDA